MLLKNVAVDFDYTLVKGDALIPGAKEAMQQLRDKGFSIIIFSCNRKKWIEKVLNIHDVPYDYIYDSSEDVGKPACDFYIDDRAIGFKGDWKATTQEVLEAYEKELQIRAELMQKYGQDADTEAGT